MSRNDLVYPYRSLYDDYTSAALRHIHKARAIVKYMTTLTAKHQGRLRKELATVAHKYKWPYPTRSTEYLANKALEQLENLKSMPGGIDEGSPDWKRYGWLSDHIEDAIDYARRAVGVVQLYQNHSSASHPGALQSTGTP